MTVQHVSTIYLYYIGDIFDFTRIHLCIIVSSHGEDYATELIVTEVDPSSRFH